MADPPNLLSQGSSIEEIDQDLVTLSLEEPVPPPLTGYRRGYISEGEYHLHASTLRRDAEAASRVSWNMQLQ